ncbi:MAG: PD-(D/E)XK nuclease family protein [Bordetella sp.]|nr:MAG: PD-(D/E)XK nuclease family protein [Bordetella sp.]
MLIRIQDWYFSICNLFAKAKERDYMQNNFFTPLDISGVIELLKNKGALLLAENEGYANYITTDLIRNSNSFYSQNKFPRVTYLKKWIIDLANELCFYLPDSNFPRRLDFFEEKISWEKILIEQEKSSSLNFKDTAQLAMEANYIMHEWDIFIPKNLETREYQIFSNCRNLYKFHLKTIHAEDFNGLYNRILTALKTGNLKIPKYLVLFGFSSYSSRLRKLISAISLIGVKLFELVYSNKNKTKYLIRYKFNSSNSEWKNAIDWALKKLIHNKTKRYAIAVSNLTESISFIHRIINQVLIQNNALFFFPFINISSCVQRDLISWPAIKSILFWFKILDDFSNHGNCSAEICGKALILGYCFHDISYADKYSFIDVQWRRKNKKKIEISEFLDALGSKSKLAKGLQSAISIWKQIGIYAKIDDWIIVMKKSLEAIGFPGERILDVIGFQLMKKLEDLFYNFSALKYSFRKLNGAESIELIRELSKSLSFIPTYNLLTCLDILDISEIEGKYWDGLWILGLNSDVLSQKVKINPFIPLKILKKYRVPGMVVGNEIEHSLNLYQSISFNAETVIVSHSQIENQDNLSPSSLIANIPLSECKNNYSSNRISLNEEVLQDENGPKIFPLEIGSYGGSDLLNIHSKNPQWSFLRYRLGARALPLYSEDVRMSNIRGNFLHRILELAWRFFRNQKILYDSLEKENFQYLLKDFIHKASIIELNSYSEILRELECNRANIILQNWFKIESARNLFFVEAIEKTFFWTYGPLKIKVRIDRIDRLEDGSIAIIDYKTGNFLSNFESDWSEARPKNIQLPLYALILSQQKIKLNLSALILARINTKCVQAEGLSIIDTGFENVKSFQKSKFFKKISLEDAIFIWKKSIHELAEEFSNGIAKNTMNQKSDLKFCDALPFLRFF